jgi:hypothetical protein
MSFEAKEPYFMHEAIDRVRHLTESSPAPTPAQQLLVVPSTPAKKKKAVGVKKSLFAKSSSSSSSSSSTKKSVGGGATAGKAKPGPKKKKDPNAPKGVVGAYLRYAIDQRKVHGFHQKRCFC